LSNSLINLLQFRYENRFPFLRQILIKQMARSLEIDVLNVQGVSEIGVEVAKICKRRGIPVVFTAHNAAYREKEELGYSYSDELIFHEEQLLWLADKIITVSNAVKGLLIERYHVPAEKFRTIYNGIDLAFVKSKTIKTNVREKYKIPGSRKIILNVGGTRTVKDIPFLVESLCLLKRDDWHLVLIGGEGERHDQVMKLCNSSIGDKFTFAGRVSDTELLNFYREASLFVATSLYEGFMLAPLEALGCGLNTLLRSTLPETDQYFANTPNLAKNNIFNTTKELANLIDHHLDGNRQMAKCDAERIARFHSWKNRAYEYIDAFRQLVY